MLLRQCGFQETSLVTDDASIYARAQQLPMRRGSTGRKLVGEHGLLRTGRSAIRSRVANTFSGAQYVTLFPPSKLHVPPTARTSLTCSCKQTRRRLMLQMFRANKWQGVRWDHLDHRNSRAPARTQCTFRPPTRACGKSGFEAKFRGFEAAF